MKERVRPPPWPLNAINSTRTRSLWYQEPQAAETVHAAARRSKMLPERAFGAVLSNVSYIPSLGESAVHRPVSGPAKTLLGRGSDGQQTLRSGQCTSTTVLHRTIHALGPGDTIAVATGP